MPDQIIDAVIARFIQIDAVRTHPLAAWAIVRDQVDYPGDLVARLITDVLTPYVARADSLAVLHAHCHPTWRAWSANHRIRRRWLRRGYQRPRE